MYILNRVLVSDPELVPWMKAEYGLPATGSEIDFNQGDSLSGSPDSWSWAAPANHTSTLEILSSEQSRHTSQSKERWFWIHQGGVGLMDLTRTYDTTNAESSVAVGKMERPMLYHEAGLSSYAGYGATVRNASLDGSVQLYEDLLCENPAWSS